MHHLQLLSALSHSPSELIFFLKKIPIQGKCRRICHLKSYIHAIEFSLENRENNSEHTQSPQASKNIKICSINIDTNLLFQTTFTFLHNAQLPLC